MQRGNRIHFACLLIHLLIQLKIQRCFMHSHRLTFLLNSCCFRITHRDCCGAMLELTTFFPLTFGFTDRISSENQIFTISSYTSFQRKSSNVTSTPSDCLLNFREECKTKGFSSETSDILQHSWRTSSIKQYQTYFKKWTILVFIRLSINNTT